MNANLHIKDKIETSCDEVRYAPHNVWVEVGDGDLNYVTVFCTRGQLALIGASIEKFLNEEEAP